MSNKKKRKTESLCYRSRYRNMINAEDRLFRILEYRNKSHGYKKQNYCDNFYYITTSNELGVIKSRGHDSGKVLGEMLIHRGVIDRWHRANKELNGDKDTYGVKGVIIKHNRVLDDIKKTIGEEDAKYLSIFFDKEAKCSMVIDKNFKAAYEPRYSGHHVYMGDLCSSSSCMSRRGDGAESFYGKIPCCNVVRFEQDGEQVGRCIMYEWNGQRHFIRIYGKPEYLPKMYKLLKSEMKPNDLFGRSKYIDGLKEKTDIADDSTNMYLDGEYYGIVRSEDEDGNGQYTMCTFFNKDEVMFDFDDAEYNNMKSTSDGTVNGIFNPEEEAYGICEHCGETIYEGDDDYVWVCDRLFCCCDCAHEEGYECCDKCGEWGYSDDGVCTDDGWYCCDTCANRDGYYKCDVCGKWEHEDYLTHVQNMYDGVCEECLDELLKDGKIKRCNWCNEYFDADDGYKMIKQEDRSVVDICDWCHNNSTYVQAHYDEVDESKEDNDVEK